MPRPDRAAGWSPVAPQADALHEALARRYPRGEADDLAQEALIRAAASSAPVPAGPGALRWLQAIARNIAIDSWRRRRPHVPLDIATHVPAMAADLDERIDLEAAIGQLSAGDRHLLQLVVSGARYEEIARAEHVTAAAIRQRVARARARLLQLLTEVGP